MKFIVSSLKLLKAVQSLGGVINSNNTLPILDDFLFNISDNELSVPSPKYVTADARGGNINEFMSFSPSVLSAGVLRLSISRFCILQILE